MTGTLRLLLGDQLSRSLASLSDIDREADTVLMVEVMEEVTYVRHHKRKVSKIFETYGSLKWFVGQEQKHLVSKGVLIPETKERSALVTSRFGEEVYQRLYGEN